MSKKEVPKRGAAAVVRFFAGMALFSWFHALMSGRPWSAALLALAVAFDAKADALLAQAGRDLHEEPKDA